MNKEGVPIDDFDPKPFIRRNAENAYDWVYNNDAVFLYDMAVRFRNQIIDPIQRLDRRWIQCETLLHEQTHLFMEHLSKVDGKKRPAHGKEFVEKCEQLGLYVLPVVGSHYQVADANSPFGRLMKQLGIERPDDVPRSETSKRDWFRPKPEKGRSTLHKWECPHCGLKIRLGINDDPRLVHDTCSNELGEKVFLVNRDDKSYNIYISKGKNKNRKDPIYGLK